MNGINSREAFSKKKSFRGGLLRLVLITGVAAAFLITRQGILDPQPEARKPLSDNDLRDLIATMTIPPVEPPPPGSRENQLAAFGKKLFFDPGLSSNGQVSCATCHQPDKFFTDGLPVAKGVGRTGRNAPTIVNARFAHWFFWDGRADSLAAQAAGPLENADEHGLDRASVAAAILNRHGSEYRKLFGEPASSQDGEALPPNLAQHAATAGAIVDPDRRRLAAYTLATIGPHDRMTALLKRASDRSMQPATLIAELLAPSPTHSPHTPKIPDRNTQVVANAVSAIEAWEKLLIADQSPFDSFIKSALENREAPLESLTFAKKGEFGSGFSKDALAGLRIFSGKANCVLCHRGPLLSDQQFHNIGLGSTDRLDALTVEQWVADVSGRARGQLEVRESPFNCRASVWPKNAGALRVETESCREQAFADLANYEAVGAFKTPTLRNVAQTAPYFHDGRAATMDEVIRHYDRLKDDPVIGHREESLRPLELTKLEKDQIKAFLESLTSPVRDLSVNN